jgi:hypothetical protein
MAVQDHVFFKPLHGGDDAESLHALENERKVQLFVDKELCKDYVLVDGVPHMRCKVMINGFMFELKPGSNEVPQTVAEIILTSPENSRYVSYGTDAGASSAPQSVGTGYGGDHAVDALWDQSVAHWRGQNTGAADIIGAKIGGF